MTDTVVVGRDGMSDELDPVQAFSQISAGTIRYEVGQAVTYKDQRYYIVGGPSNTTRGRVYELSNVPPPIRALESELRPAPPET